MSEREAGPGAPVWASLSSRGGRPDNQDRCGDVATPTGRAFIVADGLGGHAAGAVAALACVEAGLDALKGPGPLSPARLQAAFDAAQHAVQDAPRRDASAEGCRTTAVILEIGLGGAIWGHVGDTRLYHFRGGRILHQTLDHSMPQALVQAGSIRPEEIRKHPERNRLLKSLGGEGEATPTLLDAPVVLEPNDAFLLCTDGFWELATEEEMVATLADAGGPAAWLERMEALVLRAASGSFDNYSATAVILKPRPVTPPPTRGDRLGRTLARVLGFALLAAAAAGAVRCALAPSGPPPLILSGSPAAGLPGCEAPLGSGSGPPATLGPAEPRGGVGT
jgi:serine/threonine protein phosphatase PrpC